MKKIKPKLEIIILIVISIICSTIYEVVCQKLNVYSEFSIDRVFLVAIIVLFVGLHFVIGFKKLYDFIIDKRYIIAGISLVLITILGYTASSMGAISNWILEEDKNNTILGAFRNIRSDEYGVETLIASSQKNNGMKYYNSLLRGTETDMFSVIHVPVLDFLSIGRIYNIGYFFLNFDMALAFSNALKFIALLLVTFEFLQIITNKEKYISLIGTIIICFSSFIAWWGALDILIFGQLILICVENFLNSKELKKKIVWILVFAFAMISYILTLYPAWIVSFGYVFLALGIWIILKNRKVYKFSLQDGILILLSIMSIVTFCGRYLKLSENTINVLLNTSYPGNRNSNGGRGMPFLFSYGYSIFLPFIETVDNMALSSMLSMFPLPLIIAMIYVYKKEKHIDFFMPIILVTVFETIWCIAGFPDLLGKVTLMNMVPIERCAVAISLANIYIYLYMLANVEENVFETFKSKMYMTLLFLVIFYLVGKPKIFLVSPYIYILAAFITLIYFLYMNYTEKKYQKVLLTILVLLSVTGSIFVNPITKGTSIINKTDFAQKVQEIAKQNPDSIWITEDMDMVVSNYLVANNAKTLNSTQIYPNAELFEKILENNFENERNIWNRYAHIKIKLTNELSNVNLQCEDRILINLNYHKLKELGVKYIVSYNSKDILENNLMNNFEDSLNVSFEKDMNDNFKKDLKSTSEESSVSNSDGGVKDNKINLKCIYEKKTNEPKNIDGKEVSGIYIYEIVN